MAGYGYSDITSLATGGGTITFSDVAYLIDPTKCTGIIESGQVRSVVDLKGQASGYVLNPGFEEGARGVLGGVLIATTAAGRNTLQDNLKTALRSILSTTGTLNFSGGGTLAVQWDSAIGFPAMGGILKGFVFGLVSASTL